jgi:hypothetical protein
MSAAAIGFARSALARALALLVLHTRPSLRPRLSSHPPLTAPLPPSLPFPALPFPLPLQTVVSLVASLEPGGLLLLPGGWRKGLSAAEAHTLLYRYNTALQAGG